MTFAAFWALAGLVVVPVIYWLHKRKAKPQIVELPTLLFLVDEDEREHRPRTRRLDLEAVLAMCAAALLTLAAMGPRIDGGDPERRVRVVVAAGSVEASEGYADRYGQVLAHVAATTRADPVVIHEPALGLLRPSDDDLLAAARAAPAAVRIVISDRLPETDPGDVRWVAIGNPDAGNVGIVAVDVSAKDGGYEVFGTVLNDATRVTSATVRLGEQQVTLDDMQPGSYRSFTLETSSIEAGAKLVCTSDLPVDDLPADDEVVLDPRPASVSIDPDLPSRLRDAIRDGLIAAVGEAGYRESEDGDIAFVSGRKPVGAASRVSFDPIRDDAVVSAPAGVDIVRRHALTRDLSVRGADLQYRRGAQRMRDGETLLLGRGGGSNWPVLVARSNGALRFAPDPTRGATPLIDTAFWPLFLENLIGGEAASAGVRIRGLLDLDASRLGRDVAPFDPTWITAAKPDVVPPPTSLRAPLTVAGLLCLLALWSLPLLRARRSQPTAALGHSA